MANDVTFAEKCFSFEQLRFSGTTFEHYVFTILFPPICFFGITGNLLNLIVLLSKEMRSSANTLLAALALCDIIFLLLIVPHAMANFDSIASNYFFRYYYFASKILLISFANWCSATAIWFVVTVSIERVIAIRYPLRLQWTQQYVIRIVIIIVVSTFLLTFYDHYAYVCVTRIVCNGTQIVGRCHNVAQDRWLKNMTNPTSKLQQTYVKWSIIANAILVVILPTILLIISNIVLIVSFKKRNKFLQDIMATEQHDELMQQKTERKIERTAIAIVACFIITKVPSAILFAMNILWIKAFNHPVLGRYWYDAQIFASFLVICGKTTNFTLICLSSRNFRQKLIGMIKSRVQTTARPSLSMRNYEILQMYQCRRMQHFSLQ